MSAVLGQISVAIGGIFFILSLLLMLVLDVPIVTAVFRASVVMCVVSTAVALFFRFFASVLRQFVAEQVIRRGRGEDKDGGRE